MNEELELDAPFEAEEETQAETPTPEAEPPLTRAELKEYLAELAKAQQTAPAKPQAPVETDDDEFEFITKKDFKQLVKGIADTIAPIQASASKAERVAIAQEHGIDAATFDKLTEGLQPAEIPYFVSTPAFKNAAALAAQSSKPSVKAPRAANTNGGDSADPFGWLSTRLKKDVEF